MGVFDRIQETVSRFTGRADVHAELAEQRGEALAARQTIAVMRESIAELEALMREPGWQKLTAQANQEFTREGLQQITAVCRIMAIKNPLIKRGLSIRRSYVWGQGLEITGRDTKINEQIQQFLDDNKRTFSGAQAQEQLEDALGTDGNVFLACFTQPSTGRVQIRALPWDEIMDVICNPEDRTEPWYYHRQWWEERIDPGSGAVIQERRSGFYPALGYRPRQRPGQLRLAPMAETATVFWDAPVYHVKVGGHMHWKWGIPDAYAAIDWALAYKDFLTDWATLVKALSRFAWRITTKGSKQAAARSKLSSAPSTNSTTGELRHTGATAMLTPDMSLEAIPKSGASIDSESGRPVAAMVAAALDLPVTMLLGDPGMTGARAVAETLDTPTERAMEARRAVWAEALREILLYVIQESVRADGGSLKGTVTQDGSSDVLKMRGGRDVTIDISWPDLDEIGVETVIRAISIADQSTYLPPLTVARLYLEALGVSDVDAVLEKITGPDGEFLRPEGSMDAGDQAAVRAVRQDAGQAELSPGGERLEPPQDRPEQKT